MIIFNIKNTSEINIKKPFIIKYMVETTFLILNICSIIMTYAISLLHDCGLFKAFQSGIECRPLEVRETVQKHGSCADLPYNKIILINR